MNDIEKTALDEISKTQTIEELEKIRIKYLGRKGIISHKLAELVKLTDEEKKNTGKQINTAKRNIADAISKRNVELRQKKISSDISETILDITLPGKPFEFGKLHPLTQVMNDIKRIFAELGFSVETGPDIETDFYNFTALNIPENHPARDMQDTFYIKTQELKNSRTQELLLRTHTSPVQIRVMEKQKPPVRVIVPGRVYRHEAVDAAHSFTFHQVEGLAVDENITFSELKTVLEIFVKRMFGNDITTRFRPSYFPFTEPSAEVDIKCLMCNGNGCSVCKQTGWVELLGCGMVNPKVFEFVGYTPEKYTGYAFGMGIERITMLKFGIDDMRLFYENDLDFLRQF
ncbi:MAG: phenylalanine--tRNA ligase subunit alpha [Elusimicrobiota bacterium]